MPSPIPALVFVQGGQVVQVMPYSAITQINSAKQRNGEARTLVIETVDDSGSYVLRPKTNQSAMLADLALAMSAGESRVWSFPDPDSDEATLESVDVLSPLTPAALGL